MKNICVLITVNCTLISPIVGYWVKCEYVQQQYM